MSSTLPMRKLTGISAIRNSAPHRRRDRLWRQREIADHRRTLVRTDGAVETHGAVCIGLKAHRRGGVQLPVVDARLCTPDLLAHLPPCAARRRPADLGEDISATELPGDAVQQ